MAKLRIPISELPALNGKNDSYFIRYRLITSDRNSFSYWSNIYGMPMGTSYVVQTPNASISSNVLSVTWGNVTGVNEYDVWISWTNKNYEAQTVVNKQLTSSTATITTGTNNSYSVGDSLTISDVDTIFDGTYTVTSDSPNTISYPRYYSNVASTVVSPSGTIHPSWTYYGRLSTTSFSVNAENTHASVRIYQANNPIEQNSTFLLYEEFSIS